MEKTYLVTGACGHLGGTLVRLLERTGAQVRGLRLPVNRPGTGPM